MATVKKYRKKRQMTPEQREAAIKRLAEAREKRMKENPPEYKSIHSSVLERGDDDPLNMKNVRKWIKTQKELLAVERRNVRANIKGAIAKELQIRGYIQAMESYLRNGTWTDSFWGEYQQNRVQQVCTTMAYNSDGTPKRSHGVYYPDLGGVWGVDICSEIE
jgi:hypothetical protein